MTILEETNEAVENFTVTVRRFIKKSRIIKAHILRVREENEGLKLRLKQLRARAVKK